MKRMIIALSLVFVVAGCSFRHTLSSTPTNTKQIMPSLLPMQTVALTQTMTPALTPTITQSPTPNWTPLPTLSDMKSLIEYISFTRNAECRLPCWANITPGVTDWSKAVHTLRPLEQLITKFSYDSNDRELTMGIGKLLDMYNEFSPLDGREVSFQGYVVALQENEDKVRSITLDIQSGSAPIPDQNIPFHVMPLPESFSMRSVLQEYGQPSYAVLTADVGGPFRPSITITLVYTEYQFYAKYYFDAELRGDSVVACNPAHSIDLLVLDNKDIFMSIESLEQDPESEIIIGRKPLEDVLGMSLADFYQIYKTGAECIKFPKKNWH